MCLLFTLSACTWLGEEREADVQEKSVVVGVDKNRGKESQWLCYGQTQHQGWNCRTEARGDVLPNPRDVVKSEVLPIAISKPAEKQTTGIEKILENEGSVDGSFATQKKITEIDGSYYAVQLYAGVSVQSGREFIKRRGLSSPRLLSIESRSESWYVVLLGLYPTREQAEKIAAEFNRSSGGEVPWVRSVEGLKKLLLKELEP